MNRPNESICVNDRRKKAMKSFTFVVKKTDARMKCRTFANGSVQRPHTDKDATASPTTSAEATLITAVIDAGEDQDVATMDELNAFMQSPLCANEGERITVKTRFHQ